MKKLEYVDLKRSIEHTRESIETHETALQIERIVLKALEKEIENYQPPLRLKKEK